MRENPLTGEINTPLLVWAVLTVEDNGKPAERGIVPVGKPIQPQTGISIRNHQDIAREVLNSLPKEQVEELAKIAAAELLRLQIQELESRNDGAEVEQKVDKAFQALEKADRTQGADLNYQTEHKTAKGTTRISVQSRPVPAPPPVQVAPQGRQVSGSCFVATACYGDYDHPTVMVLRHFRDFTLMESAVGRMFVASYYRRGPYLARLIERVPVLKPPLRMALGLFARAYSVFCTRLDTLA